MGRPAAGKSTLARRIKDELKSMGVPVENLDGDEVRKNLHPDLGFSKEDRALNNRRTAFVAKLLNRNGINTVTAMITPFREAQQRAREVIQTNGSTFVLIYVKCPVEVAAERDPKDLYKKAKAGEIEMFTGINHPFEEPIDPNIVIDTEQEDIEDSVRHILVELANIGVFQDVPQTEYAFDISDQEEENIKHRLAELGYLD
jgi:adenylylsulfate kinase